MKKTILVLFTASAFLFACSNSNQSADTESVQAPDSLVQIPAPASPDASVQLPATENTEAMTTPPAPVPSSVPPPPSPQQSATASGMNPPHGEPGHRCDIPVGAPLSSAPSTPAPAPSAVTAPSPNASGISTPQVVTAPPPPMPAPSATTTAPGMNPPHGEPGHDCSIPVGAPLKKK